MSTRRLLTVTTLTLLLLVLVLRAYGAWRYGTIAEYETAAEVHADNARRAADAAAARPLQGGLAQRRPRAAAVAATQPRSQTNTNACASRVTRPNAGNNKPVAMARTAYRVGDTVQNHMRVVGKVSQALHQVLPERDPLATASYRTCAVVASAGILRLRKLGAYIDDHDAVIRFNTAHTEGLEDFVGRRTTIRLVNRENFGYRENDDEIVLQHVTTETMLAEVENHLQGRPNERLYAISPAFYKRVVTSDNTHPTNGYFGIRLALELCDCVRLFGFVRSWRGYMTYHYHDDYTPRKSQHTRDGGEWPMVLNLLRSSAGRIRYAHACVLNQICEGCPEVNGQAAATCDTTFSAAPNVAAPPYPVPSRGHCYGHGPPGGSPGLRRWAPREYWSNYTGWGGRGGRRLHANTASGVLRMIQPAGRQGHGGGGGGGDHHAGGGHHAFLTAADRSSSRSSSSSSSSSRASHASHASQTSAPTSRASSRRQKVKSTPAADAQKTDTSSWNEQLPTLPYGDQRRSCFRPCARGEFCNGGASQICSEASIREHPDCLPWDDVSEILQSY